MLVDRETVAGRVMPEVRLEWRTFMAPVLTVVRFSRQKPLGAVGGFIVLGLFMMALLAPALSPYDPRQIIREANNRVPVYVTPGPTYLLGTDHVGRDVLSRIIHGARISLYVGFGAVLIGVTGWFVVGLVSAYAGGTVDLIVQRLVDAMMAVPGLAIFIAVLGFNLLGDALRDALEPRLRGVSTTARLLSRG